MKTRRRPRFIDPAGRLAYRSCYDKRRFGSKAEALACNGGQRPYYCPLCDGFHLTKQ